MNLVLKAVAETQTLSGSTHRITDLSLPELPSWYRAFCSFRLCISTEPETYVTSNQTFLQQWIAAKRLEIHAVFTSAVLPVVLCSV